MNFRRNQFRSLREAQNKASRLWVCSACLTRYDRKVDACACGGAIEYFPSKREAKRYDLLRRRQISGEIEALVCHPPFPIVVNGVKVATYYADFLYFDETGMVVEDVKATLNPKGHDPLFKLKKKLAEAAHGVTISIVK